MTSTEPDAKSGLSFTNPERAAQIYHILCAAAKDRRTLTYGLLAEMTGAFPANLGYLLGYIMRFCEKHNPPLPPLTVLVVQTGTGKPGDGLLTSHDHDADRERVFTFEWYKRVKPPLPQELASI